MNEWDKQRKIGESKWEIRRKQGITTKEKKEKQQREDRKVKKIEGRNKRGECDIDIDEIIYNMNI